MFLRGSRYEKSRPFDPPEDGGEAFPGVRPRPVDTPPGVVEHVVASDDRLDLLARHYYGDDRLWWRLLDANPEIVDPADAVRDEDAVAADGTPRPGRVGRPLLVPRAKG